MTDLDVGNRLCSTVCDTEIIVVRGPSGLVELGCGGHPMTANSVRALGSPEPGADGGTVLGKRYVDEQTGLEVLCTKPGTGSLAVDGRALTIKAPQSLPASD